MGSPFLWEKGLPALLVFVFVLDMIYNVIGSSSDRLFLVLANNFTSVFTIVLISLPGLGHK